MIWPLYELCGRVSDVFGRIYGHARFARELSERDARLRELTVQLCPSRTVQNGPFRGMKYTSQSYGSSLLPKLIGTYESELHPAIEELLRNDYSTIIDIGCAEGYYAVGLGMRCPRAQVFAFDTAPSARQLCTQLAEINGIANRIHIDGFCDGAKLASLCNARRALVISDCEGYEYLLFTEDVVPALSRHDLIIEAHDFINIEITSKLRERFSLTHEIESIKSTDDIQKAHTYQSDLLRPFDTITRKLILAERRPAIMEWLVMTSRDRL